MALKTGFTVIITNNKGEIIWVNQAFEKTTGYKLDEIAGKLPHSFLSGKKSDIQQQEQIMNDLLSNNRVTGEILNYKKNGESFWFEYDIVGVLDNNGSVINYISTQIDITERKKLQLQLVKSNNEKEVLLAEVHHRVKNNLQIVSGLIELQIRKATDMTLKNELKETKSRIQSISLVHERLYQNNNFSSIDLKQYFNAILNEIKDLFSSNKCIKINLEIHPINMEINKAIPLGLLVNEIISNIYKHAYVALNEGEISFKLYKHKNQLLLEINDNGIGFDINHKIKEQSIGLKLIEALANQIDAKWSVKSEKNKGTTYKLELAIYE